MTFTKMCGSQHRGVWDEELMCDVEPESRKRSSGARANAGSLRTEISARNLVLATQKHHEVTRGTAPSVVYSPCQGLHGNFIDASYKRICAHVDWARRLEKIHTAKAQARPSGLREEVRVWRELDTAASSDALLMNIFCYPRVFGKRLCTLLGVESNTVPVFGYKPRLPLLRGLRDRTEIDMRLPGLLVEAKLTESNFQRAAISAVERYVGFDEVFDRELLKTGRDEVQSYQLVRGAMIAWHTKERFCVLSDARRPDLLEAWFQVIRAVKRYELRSQMQLLTWQELAGCLPVKLQSFLYEKYGITSA